MSISLTVLSRTGRRSGVSALLIEQKRSVPQSILAFLESTDYEDAVRNAISLGGDADTMACIAGGIAEAYYGGLPREIAEHGLDRLDERLRCIVSKFRERYCRGLGHPA